jgi:S-DNA-T family DNA segregation ATPase FtsK/SpoIIIE
MDNKTLQKKIINESLFILLTVLGVFYLTALLTHTPLEDTFSTDALINNDTVQNYAGTLGAYVSDMFLSFFGFGAYTLPIALIWFGLSFHNKTQSIGKFLLLLRLLSFVVFLLSISALSSALPTPDGGWIGQSLGHFFTPLLGWMVYALYTATLLISYAFSSAQSWSELLVALRFNRIKFDDKQPPVQTNTPPKPKRKTKKTSLKLRKTLKKSSTEQSPMPALKLLSLPHKTKDGYSQAQLNDMGQRVVNILKDFGFEIEITQINPGPVITQFEVALAAGVKVSQIINLNKDLARALLVESVRIVDTIPGKPVIGIEIPNAKRDIIALQEILKSDEFTNSDSKLTMALGKNINGEAVVANLAKMPHLLVAGATGMGKSVGLNSMIVSVLYKAKPSEVRMIMIDPKIVELAVYADIPHLLTPVVTDMNEAASSLWWCVNEMERRYQLLAKFGVRNLDGFNEKVRLAKVRGEPLLDPSFNEHTANEGESANEMEPLPLIMVIIDEYADMLGALAQDDRAKSKRVEGFIIRLAQKARAAGIHLIIATQRPSVDVITGLIKSNIPTRIAFKVSSKVDSRTIVDAGGAEQLLGMGDMLYMTPGLSSITRVHGAFVDDDEIIRVVEYLKANYETDYQTNILQAESALEEEPSNTKKDTSGELDALYDEAVEVVTSSGRASISSLQRRMRIGYNRAARIIEDMESAGVVSSMNSAGNRQVLAPKPREHDE